MECVEETLRRISRLWSRKKKSKAPSSNSDFNFVPLIFNVGEKDQEKAKLKLTLIPVVGRLLSLWWRGEAFAIVEEASEESGAGSSPDINKGKITQISLTSVLYRMGRLGEAREQGTGDLTPPLHHLYTTSTPPLHHLYTVILLTGTRSPSVTFDAVTSKGLIHPVQRNV